MKKKEMCYGIVMLVFLLSMGACSNDASPSDSYSTLDLIKRANYVQLPTFSDPSQSDATSKVAEIYGADNYEDTAYLDGGVSTTDKNEAYWYIENMNDNFIVKFPNSMIDTLKSYIANGATFENPTKIEFGEFETIDTITRADATMQMVESDNRIRFYGYVNLYIDLDKDGDVNTGEGDKIYTETPFEFSFSSDFSDLLMTSVQGTEYDQTLYYDYENNSGTVGFKNKNNGEYEVEQIGADSSNAITFKRVSNKTAEITYDIFMYSIYGEGIVHYFQNDGSPIYTYYNYSNGTVIDGSTLDPALKQSLDTAIENIIAETPNDSIDNSSAEAIYEGLPRANLEAPEFADILAAHQSNYDY